MHGSYLLTDEDRQYFNMMKIILFYYLLLLLFRNIQNVLLNNLLDPVEQKQITKAAR